MGGQVSFESASEEASTIQPGEVLELLEGPRQEEPVETQRMRGKAASDGKVGWVTLNDPQGNANFEQTKVLVCNQSIAITTTYDIVEGKTIRKLEVDETLEVLEEAKEDPVRGLSRVKAKAKTDGVEGWVTIKGSKGTAYVEDSTNHYVCKKGILLERKFASDSETVRRLEEGEMFEVTEGPKPETKEGALRFRGRATSDGKEAWFTLGSKNFQQWAPKYKCAHNATLDDVLSPKDARAVRKLETGEVLDALGTPVCDKESGLLRVRVRAAKDAAVGFSSLRSLKPVLGGDS